VVAEWPPLARQLAAAFWPGPLTLVLPRAAVLPPAVSAGLSTVAVRAPSHPVARALIRRAGLPVAAPSANRFGHISPTTAEHVLEDLGAAVDLVLDGGPTPGGLESTVVAPRADLALVLRPGALTLEDLAEVAPRVALAAGAASAGPQPAPGQLARHYAPEGGRVVLLRGADKAVARALGRAGAELALAGYRVGLLLALEDAAQVPLGADLILEVLAERSDPEGAAARLYAGLRALEQAGCEVILARDWGEAGLGLALGDRLSRAAEGRVVTVGQDPEGAVQAIRQLVHTGSEAADASAGPG
jgi:L-threonylcarbamoyladenylate synthase